MSVRDRITVCSPGAPEWTSAIAHDAHGEARGAILFIGTVEPRKNIGGILEAYARLRERRPDAPPLVMVGRVTDSQRVVLQRASRAATRRACRLSRVTSARKSADAAYREARMLRAAVS